MTRPRSRAVLLLCVLLILQEFGPAHFLHIRPAAISSLEKQNDESEEAEMQQQDDEIELQSGEQEKQETNHKDKDNAGKNHEKGSRRGFGSIVKNVIKVAKAGNQIIPKVVLVASLSNTVIRAIAGCCLDFPQACQGNEEIAELRANISTKSKILDEIQVEAKNIQEWTESTSDEFATVLFKLNAILDNSEILVKAMSPAVQTAITKMTTQIKKLVREKNEIGETLGFIEAQSMYNSAVKIALGISLPLLTGIIPAIPQVVKFAQRKMGLRNTYTLDESIKGALKKPAPSSPKSANLKGWVGKTKAKINAKLTSFKNVIDTKYGGAIKLLKKVGEGVTLVLGYVGSAYGIYNIIASAQGCKDKRDKVLESLKEFRQASNELDLSINNATQSKSLVQEAWVQMKEDLTSDALMNDLKEVQKVIGSLAGQSEDLKKASEQVQAYIDRVKSAQSYNDLYDRVIELSEGLGSVPFTLQCYTSKVQMTDYVLRECKKGSDNFAALYQQGLEQFDTNAGACQDKVGFEYIAEDSLMSGLEEYAKQDNFEKDCLLNSPLRKSQACILKDQGYDTTEIANRMGGISAEQVQALTQNCPKATITPEKKKQVCNLRKLNLQNKDIAAALELDVQQVEAVKCQ